MKSREIKSELVRLGITQTSIAKKIKPPVTIQAVNQTIARADGPGDGRWVSNRIMQAVSDAIGKPVQYVFSDYFYKIKKAS